MEIYTQNLSSGACSRGSTKIIEATPLSHVFYLDRLYSAGAIVPTFHIPYSLLLRFQRSAARHGGVLPRHGGAELTVLAPHEFEGKTAKAVKQVLALRIPGFAEDDRSFTFPKIHGTWDID